jgi:hypothetical protein
VRVRAEPKLQKVGANDAINDVSGFSFARMPPEDPCENGGLTLRDNPIGEEQLRRFCEQGWPASWGNGTVESRTEIATASTMVS